MKINYPTKRKIEKFGKSYLEFLEIECQRGNLSKKDFLFWKKVNIEVKKNPGYKIFHFYCREWRSLKKQIPFNA